MSSIVGATCGALTLFFPQRRDRNIDDIKRKIVFVASSWVKLVLERLGLLLSLSIVVVQVNGKEEELCGIVVFSDDFFGPVPMMDIKVHNRATLAKQSLVGYGMHGTSCNAVEDTKSA